MSQDDTDRVRSALAAPGAPRFATPNVLARLAGGVAPGRIALAALGTERALTEAGQGLYANRLARPSVHPNEVVAHLSPGAYVGLHTVLGEHGVANNPSRVVYAVRPAAPDRVRDACMTTPFAEIRILSMDPAILGAGDESDRLEGGGRYARATPERSLCDWFHLASDAGGRLMAQPPLDLDLDDLDAGRLDRLADAMGVAGALADWKARHAEAMSDPDFEAQVGPLGF